jgi:ParB family chromosome partitioning protein
MFYQPRTIEWWTPREYIDMAREVMGGIDLDPASCAEANKIVKAKRFYDTKTDGLKQPWFGRTWVNPPYAGNAGQFVEKLLAEKACGNVTEAIALISATTVEREWFKPLWDYCLCFHYGRIKFISPDTELIDSMTSPMTGSIFIYLGHREKRFAAVFSQVGAIVKRWP